MSNVISITTAAAAANLTRKPRQKVKRLSASGNITEKECTTKVEQRTKYYDKRCKGLYLDISPTSPATFSVKCKGKPIKIGLYHPTELTIEIARIEADRLKSLVSQGRDIARERQVARLAVKNGKTVNEVIELRIAYLSEVVDHPNGLREPRRRDHANVTRHLRNYVSPAIGKRMIRNVTRQDIVDLDRAVGMGTLVMANGKTCKPSPSNRRHVRCAVSSMFDWAAQVGDVDHSPVVNLLPLDFEASKDRVLTDDEIRIFWHGLDRDDLGIDRRTRLGLKFALVTMLRSLEMLGAPTSELAVHDDGTDCIDVHASRVKKKRTINQPLTKLAMEIVKESKGNYDWLFAGRWGDAPLSRQAMSNALAGKKASAKAKEQKGICEQLGLVKFTPHDLRRTAATLAGRAGFSDAMIGYCLDHQKQTNKTTGIYNRAERKNMTEKRQVLEAIEWKVRQIVGLDEADRQHAA